MARQIIFEIDDQTAERLDFLAATLKIDSTELPKKIRKLRRIE